MAMGLKTSHLAKVLVLRARPNWNPRAPFLVLLLGDFKEVDIQSRTDIILKKLWWHLVPNAAVIASNAGNQSNTD